MTQFILLAILMVSAQGLPPAGGDTLPSWHPNAVNTIVTIDSGTTIGSAARAAGCNDVSGISTGGGSDPDDITAPWSGGALVTLSGQVYLLAYGGGHGDAWCNVIVKFGPLTGSGSDSPTWSTFLAPSANDAVRDAATYTDGRQSAVHSYNNLVGIGDTLYSMHTDGYHNTGNSTNLAFKFTSGGQTALANNTSTGLFGATDHYNGNIYYIAGNANFDRIRVYNIAGDSWSNEGNGDLAWQNYVDLAIDTTRGAIFVTNGADSVYWTISGWARATGRNSPSNFDFALEYDENIDRFVSYVDGAQSLRYLDAASLASGGNPSWTTQNFSGATPGASEPNGIFGRFRCIPELFGCIVAPSLEDDVYFFQTAVVE